MCVYGSMITSDMQTHKFIKQHKQWIMHKWSQMDITHTQIHMLYIVLLYTIVYWIRYHSWFTSPGGPNLWILTKSYQVAGKNLRPFNGSWWDPPAPQSSLKNGHPIPPRQHPGSAPGRSGQWRKPLRCHSTRWIKTTKAHQITKARMIFFVRASRRICPTNWLASLCSNNRMDGRWIPNKINKIKQVAASRRLVAGRIGSIVTVSIWIPSGSYRNRKIRKLPTSSCRNEGSSAQCCRQRLAPWQVCG